MSVSSPPILKILSDLDIDLIDVNNDVDYLRALMEATNALVITNASDKRIPVLQKEIKRVRADRKKADPKFNQKVKKTIVSPQKIMGQKMLPPAKLDPKKLSSQGGGGDTVSQILVSVTSIRDILVNQIKQKRDDANKKRRATENVKRKDKESGLEILKKGFGAVKSGAEKIIKPVKSLFGQVLEFIGKVVFGRVIFKLFEWFSDKKNQDKVKAIGKFLKKTWPVLLASYLLFGNAFGRMAVKLGVMITKFSIRLVTKIIPALVKAIAKMKMGKMGKFGLIAGGIMAVGTAGYMMTRGGKDEEEIEVPSVSPRGDRTDAENQKFDEMSAAKGFNKGGPVSGSGNTDTVPAMLTPGEFVMSKGAVEKYGVKTLEGMNAAAGGTNIPTLKGRFNKGGIVTDPEKKKRIEEETLYWVNKERVEFLGLPPLDKISYADGVELTEPMGKEFYGAGITEESSDDWNFDTMTRTTTRWKQKGSKMIFEGGEEIITEEQKQAYLDSNPLARMAMELKDQMELDIIGADISESAKRGSGYRGGGLVQGFQGGGLVQSKIDQYKKLRMERSHIERDPDGKIRGANRKKYHQLSKEMDKLHRQIEALQKSTSTPTVTPTVTPKVPKTKTGSGLFGGIKRVVGGTADQLTGNLFDFDKRSGGGLIRKTAGAVGGLFGGGKKGGGGSSGILGPIGNVDDMVNKDKYKASPKTDAVKKEGGGGSSGILGPISSDHSKMVNKDKYKVNPPVKKSVVQAYEEEKSKIVALGGGGGNTVSKSKGGNDLPNIDAAEKRSVHKIKTLGISV